MVLDYLCTLLQRVEGTCLTLAGVVVNDDQLSAARGAEGLPGVVAAARICLSGPLWSA